MNIKIRNGTTPSERLCDSCKFSHIAQGEGTMEIVRCLADYDDVWTPPFLVVKCNKYRSLADSLKPSLDTLVSMAYILTEDGPLKSIGFVSPREWQKRRKKGDSILPPIVPDYD